MDNLARIAPTQTPPPHLGPGVVISVAAGRIGVRIAGRVVEARPALAFPYDAREGDSVLVIGNDEGHYVIGVLAGSGETRLSFPGDVELRAESGKLRLSGAEGVAIDGPEIELQSARLRMIAGAVVQRFTTLAKSVRELFSLQAGSMQTQIEGSSHTQAKSATILTEEKVCINGKAIHLG